MAAVAVVLQVATLRIISAVATQARNTARIIRIIISIHRLRAKITAVLAQPTNWGLKIFSIIGSHRVSLSRD